jgi:NAD(P)-dependent dehydrogenase (short-subunit alcohol dehydrogenase family)
MDVTLKPIDEQVMVITGASSGIGLVTAKMAARQGASVVLAARNENDLERAVNEIRADGGRAVHLAGDVADAAYVERIADTAVREFGHIDTWVNNAAVAVYGRIMEVDLDDMRRQFDVNYWGQVHGSRTAVPHLRRRGGALINVASALADRAIPLQGNYCAAKHALKAFTDSLRMELEEEGAPISVTLVKPGSIDTPFFEKAKTYLGVEPQPVPPVYAPEVVAGAILHCAQHPTRDIITGGMGKMLSIANGFPRLADKYMEKTTFESQKTDVPVGDRPNNLYAPVAHDGGERGSNWTGRTKGTSLYTKAALHPGMTAVAAAVGVGLIAATLLGRRSAARTDGSIDHGMGGGPGDRLERSPLPEGVSSAIASSVNLTVDHEPENLAGE